MVKKRRGQSAAFMRSINPYLKKRRKARKHSFSIKLNKRTKMARRRFTKHRRSSRRSGASVLGVNTAMALGAIIYGAARQKTSQMVAPYTSKLPLGNISDEVGMLAITTLGKKFLFKGKGVIRDALTAGQTIELARIGEAVVSGDLGLFNGSSGATSNGNIF